MDEFIIYSKHEERLQSLISFFNESDQKKIKSAVSLAARYHADQERGKDDIENAGYIIHCVRSARWLLEWGVTDVNIIIGAILHDTLEDTSLESEIIKKQFGDDVLALVLGVTRPRPENEPLKIKIKSKHDHFTKILNGDERIRLIKAADAFDNMSSWPYHEPNEPRWEKIPRWFDEAKKYYLPLVQSTQPKAIAQLENIYSKMKKRYEEYEHSGN